ncbi:hypothetical protein KI387_042802, partial [Taxus chinensis]
VTMSSTSHNMSDEEGEQEPMGVEYETLSTNVMGVEGSSSIGSATGHFSCPSKLLEPFAKGPFEKRSPLSQFAMKQVRLGATRGTRTWKCHFCQVEFQGSITRVNAHLLHIRGKGVGPCDKLSLKQRAEINKLWGCNTEGKPVSTTLAMRSATPSSARTFHGAQLPTYPSSSTSGAVEPKGKHKMTGSSDAANTVAELFNVQNKDDADDAIGKLFFACGIPFHVARSPYYKDVVAKITRAGPSYVPPGETKLRTTILDKNYSKINILMEKMKATWVTTGCNIIMDGWTNIRHHPLINIMVTCTEGPYFLKAIDCSGHVKDADFQFQILRDAIEEVGLENVVQVVMDAAH